MRSRASGRIPDRAAPGPGPISTDRRQPPHLATGSGQANLRLAPAYRPLDRAVPLDPDPDLQHGRSGLRIERPDPAAAFDRFVDQHRSSKVHLEAEQRRGVAQPVDEPGGQGPHGVHAVGDHARKARGASHLVVPVERVLVARRVRVRLDVLPGDRARGGRQALPHHEIVESSAHPSSRTISVLRPDATSSPASSTTSVRRVRNRMPPLSRTPSIVADAVSVSPTTTGRDHRYSCSPWRTRDRSIPSRGSDTTWSRPASISGTVTIVGGTPGPRCPTASANARTRASSTRNRAGGYVLPSTSGFNATQPDVQPTRLSGARPSPGRPIHTASTHCEGIDRAEAQQVSGVAREHSRELP